MPTLFARQALIAEDWADNVRIEIGGGVIERTVANADAGADDLQVGIAIPGICNSHSHAFQRALLGRSEYRGENSTDTFWTWRQLMYGVAARVGPEELTAIARQVYVEMLTAGYTTVVEFHYLHGVSANRGAAEMRDALVAAADESGIRLVYLPVYYERADFDGTPLSQAQQRFSLTLEQYLEHVAESRKRLGSPHAVGVAAHSLRAVSQPALDVLANDARRRDLPIHLHIAEQQLEVAASIDTYGQRPVRWLLDNFDIDERWTLVHATHIDPGETAALAASAAVTCLCPSTEGNLGDGFFPLEDYLHGGGGLAIGSDSHVTINPFEELRWLEYGQRLLAQKRNVAAVHEAHTGMALYRGALRGGAQSARTGPASLVDGAAADLIVLDDAAPLLCGLRHEAVLDALVFGGLPSAVDRVMVDGRWRVIDGGHTGRCSGGRLRQRREAFERQTQGAAVSTRRKPRYQQVKDLIIDRISCGSLRPNDRVPSENELVEATGVSRMTANRALRELTSEGYVERVAGSGTFVADLKATSHPLEVRNIADEVAVRGHRHSSRVMAHEAVVADRETAAALELRSRQRVFHAQVVHYEDGRPIQLEDRYVVRDFAPDFLDQDFAQTTPSAYLSDISPLQEAEHVVRAEPPAPVVRAHLQMDEHEPCLVVVRRTWGRGKPVTFGRLYHPGSRFELTGHFLPPGQAPGRRQAIN